MMDFALARRMMVDGQVRTSNVTNLALLDAMSEVPRELFVPDASRATAYLDRHAPLTSSSALPRFLLRPAVLAALIQAARVEAWDRALVVGCATGYSAVVLAKLCSRVVAVESDGDLAAMAASLVRRLDVGNVDIVTAPFADGAAGEGPYDVIVVDGGLWTPPQSLFLQLKDGGRLVAVMGGDPVGKVTVFTSVHGEVSGRPLADARVPPLTAKANDAAFVF